MFSSAEGGCVESVVAFDKAAATGSSSLVAVWYIRGGDNSSQWTAKTWFTGDPWKVVEYIKDEKGIPDEHDWLWGVLWSEGAANASTPVDYASGVASADPLAALIAEPALHDALVEELVAAEYPVADVTIEKVESGCGTSAVLTDLAEVAEAVMGTGEEAVHNAAVAMTGAASLMACSAVIVPISWRPLGPPSIWTTWCVTVTPPTGPAITTCTGSRKQKFFEKRTCAKTGPGGLITYCDQQRITECTESGTCVVPGPGPCTPGTTPNVPPPPGSTCDSSNPWASNPPGCTCD